MTIEGVDYAWARANPAQLFAAGKRFACRYGGPGSDGKQVDPAEARALSAAGVAIVANAEGAEDGLLGGYSTGRSWALDAEAHFRRCGMPAGRPIYLSVDFAVTSAQWPAVAAALRGAASVLGAGRVGVYGGVRAVQWARRDGVARWFWQTFAWSAGQWAAGNNIEQYRNRVALAGSSSLDLDRALTVDYGQWTVGQTGGVEDMADFTNADTNAWHQAVRVDALRNLQDVNSLGEPMPVVSLLKAIAAKVDIDADELAAIEAAAAAGAETGTLAAADAIVARILAGIQQGADLTPAQMDQVEQAVRNAFAGGLAPNQPAGTGG